MEDFYCFIKEHYNNRLFTKEDLSYIYHGKEVSEEEVMNFTTKLIDSIYFVQDKFRYFLFKISDELEIMREKNKEITVQELEDLLIMKIKNYPYKKISFYKGAKRIVVTFDFPRVIDEEFDYICNEFLEETGYRVEKNNNINNLACETVIKEEIGRDNIQKISYLPLEDCFKIKVYELPNEIVIKNIQDKIGYHVSTVLVPKIVSMKRKTISDSIFKMEQNEALNYIDSYFSEKEHKPYKKSIKNGSIVLSFITYEIGMKYVECLEELSRTTGYEIELNRNANMSMIFDEVNALLMKYHLSKMKNPSYLPEENKVSVKIESAGEKEIELFTNEFYEKVGLGIKIII